MDYISERIINISELEHIIEAACHDMSALRTEMETETPSMEILGELSKRVQQNLLRAREFEFCVERRRATSVDG